jgi:pimeloyl-ACP methyl ester carboxylesterase
MLIRYDKPQKTQKPTNQSVLIKTPETTMTTFTENDIQTHGTQLHYYRSGGKGTPIVLAHGITDDGLCWTPVAKTLADRYDIIMVDARGHGKSEAPESGGYDQATMATELAGLISGLGLKKPVVLGHSMGAATALYFSALFPELPRAIILEDPPVSWLTTEPTGVEDDYRADFIAGILANKRKTRGDLLAECRKNHPGWSEGELEPWIDSKHRFSPRITQIIRSAQASSEVISALLQKITCPLLLVTGDQERGSIMGETETASLQALVPHLQLAQISGAGHNIRRDQFAAYMEVVKLFLKNISVGKFPNFRKSEIAGIAKSQEGFPPDPQKEVNL